MIGHVKFINFNNFKAQLFEQRESRCIDKKQDLVIVVCGNEGSGKTIFSLGLGGVDPKFYDGFQVYFEWYNYLKVQNDFIKYINKLSDSSPINFGSVLVYDEAGTQLHSRSSMANTDQIKMYIANRFLRLIHILNIPKINSLDKYVREERVKIFVWIDYNADTGRRIAYVYGKESLGRIYNRPYWWQLFTNTNWLITTVKPDYAIQIPNLIGPRYIPTAFHERYEIEKAKFNLGLTNEMMTTSKKYESSISN
jgi:hypothetical protein